MKENKVKSDGIFLPYRTTGYLNEYSVYNNYENLNFSKNLFKREDKNVVVRFNDYAKLSNNFDSFFDKIVKLQKFNDINLCFDVSNGLFNKNQYLNILNVVDKIEEYNKSVKTQKKIEVTFVEDYGNSNEYYKTYNYHMFKLAHNRATNFIDLLNDNKLSPLEALTSMYLKTSENGLLYPDRHSYKTNSYKDSIYNSLINERMESEYCYNQELDELAKIYGSNSIKITKIPLKNDQFVNEKVYANLIYINDKKYNVDGCYLALPQNDKEINAKQSLNNFLIPVKDLKAFKDEFLKDSYINLNYIKDSFMELIKDNGFYHEKPISFETISAVLKNINLSEDKIKEIYHESFVRANNEINLDLATNGLAVKCKEKALKQENNIAKENDELTL